MRLGDLDEVREKLFSYYPFINENTSKRNSERETLMDYEIAAMIEDCIENATVIDPETIPVTMFYKGALTAMLKESDKLNTDLDRVRRNEGNLYRELERVKAERDAAIRDVEWLVTGEIKACDYCKKNNPYNYTCERMEMGYCADWEWSGVQGENNS